MNVLQGKFFSTAFRVKDDDAFEGDIGVVDLRHHVDIYSGNEGEETLHCIVSKDCQPRTKLRVAKLALLGLLADAKASTHVMEDELGWIALLQKHIHEEDGMVVVNQCVDGQEYQTYIASDCAGWTR
jgi:hypothetical protein